ncbi:hypothetical protein HW532_20820 [Kaustia mangrovi]|uniref:Uncharacterized protein n=1 Tax=Kaustia mangrovi TaxID=2593653 RepID=A0A7S8HE23_9HYPH|nr:hypothetical protein [Kaustia mangrovi]QPC44923.1 hypothetical protein HW532_20820 [Kaustia mangrovi]
MFNMTVREAMQRCAVNRVRIKRTGYDSEWRVTLNEWTGRKAKDCAYFTDDLEDAVITGARMRREAERLAA